MSSFPVIHLRETAKALIDAGYKVKVEDWSDRIYKIDEFKAAGAEIVPAGSWRDAPKEHIILGLKEIESDGTPLPHTAVHFHHCFKRQNNWQEELSRFAKADGLLYDLEFLVSEDGRRVAAFGFWAGFAGTALGLLSWAHQILHPGTALGPVPLFESATELTDLVKSKVTEAIAGNGQWPRVMVMGALGRCGKGAVEASKNIGVPEENIVQWDLNETKAKPGPYEEVAQSDIFGKIDNAASTGTMADRHEVNCVYLGPNKAPPFLTAESLSEPQRRLRTIVDVSCDPNSENNPIPIYDSYSNFENPTLTPSVKIDGPEIRIISIDHLPTMVARESSDEFSGLLLPSLLNLNRRDTDGVWTRAEKTFRDRVAELD